MWSKLTWDREGEAGEATYQMNVLVTKALSHDWAISTFLCQTSNNTVFENIWNIAKVKITCKCRKNFNVVWWAELQNRFFWEKKEFSAWLLYCWVNFSFEKFFFEERLGYIAKSSTWFAVHLSKIQSTRMIWSCLSISKLTNNAICLIGEVIYDCLRCLDIHWLLCEGKIK